MKVGIFYFSKNSGPGRQLIVVDRKTMGYIRVEVVQAQDLSSALDLARPQRDETLMNTHAV